MSGTAARSGEACRMILANVDPTARSAELAGSTPKPWTRTAHLPLPFVAALANIGGNRRPDELVFGYTYPGSVKHTWDSVIVRAGIGQPTPDCCRHGFATTMLDAGYDPVTIAKRGGWKAPATVVRSYGHALSDTTVKDMSFYTPVPQTITAETAPKRKKRKRSA